jgi:excisionase family DNA binding protein
MADDMDVLYSKGDAADYLSCSERTIERLMADGELDFARVGNRVRIKRRALDDYLYRHTVKAAANMPKGKR